MTPAIPSVRSRLSAAIVAFILGFALANLAIFTIPRPDQLVWVVVAGVLMATSAWGVLVADSPRRVSVWAVLGVEIFTVFTLIPVLWVLSLAMGGESTPTTLWPEQWSSGPLRAAFDDAALRDAAGLSAGAAALATAVAVVPALGLATVLVRARWRGRRFIRATVALTILLPSIAIAVGAGDLVLRVGGPHADSPLLRVALVQLVVALPLTTWVFIAAMAAGPWSLVEAARVDGARWRTIVGRILLPTVGPSLAVGFLLTAIVVAQDFALARAVTGSQATTLPVLLLDRAADPESSALVAAASLGWAVPALVLALVAPRTITRLLGEGSYR